MASDTGGVKPMAIAGRMVRERERLLGMTNEERAWRKQWLKDQILAPNEPTIPSNYYTERYNPIRRFYRAPLEMVQKALTPTLGPYKAQVIRFWTGKALLALTGVYSLAYYFKYNQNDWTRKGGWRVIKSRTSTLPGDPGYPKTSERKLHSDYASRGFDKSPI